MGLMFSPAKHDTESRVFRQDSRPQAGTEEDISNQHGAISNQRYLQVLGSKKSRVIRRLPGSSPISQKMLWSWKGERRERCFVYRIC